MEEQALPAKKMTAYISDTVMLMNYICIVAIVSDCSVKLSLILLICPLTNSI